MGSTGRVIHISTFIHNSQNRRRDALSRGRPSETPLRVCARETQVKSLLVSCGCGAPPARKIVSQAAKRALDAAWVASLKWRVVRILVLDVVMPGIDGIEVLRRIRAKRPHLPVILVSGTVSATQIETARELGVTDVLRKPAPLNHFAEALARVRPA